MSEKVVRELVEKVDREMISLIAYRSTILTQKQFEKAEKRWDGEYDSILVAQAEKTWTMAVKWIIKWIRSHELISPDDNSITRFSPYYHIIESELKELEK